VHASGQVAHLHLEDPIKASDLHWILEKGLPYDIAVPQLELCPPAFHARRDAVSRTYLYQVSLRKSAFAKNCTWWPKLPLDLRLIEDIWPLFEGNRSMAAFADLEEGEDPNCQIYECATDRNGHLLLLRVAARFFLRKQVRRMVGALVHCAMGKADVGLLKEDLASPAPDSARNWADKTAPASGLFLESVEY
jgi:tRNA pseudouridine38-40 synthase